METFWFTLLSYKLLIILSFSGKITAYNYRKGITFLNAFSSTLIAHNEYPCANSHEEKTYSKKHPLADINNLQRREEHGLQVIGACLIKCRLLKVEKNEQYKMQSFV
jgi:hypothetical protein